MLRFMVGDSNSSLEAQNEATRLRFKPPSLDSSLEAQIQADPRYRRLSVQIEGWGLRFKLGGSE